MRPAAPAIALPDRYEIERARGVAGHVRLDLHVANGDGRTDFSFVTLTTLGEGPGVTERNDAVVIGGGFTPASFEPSGERGFPRASPPMGGKGMSAQRSGNSAGIGVGGILVIVGIILAIVWSVWAGIIVALIGLIAFGGFARGKWY